MMASFWRKLLILQNRKLPLVCRSSINAFQLDMGMTNSLVSINPFELLYISESSKKQEKSSSSVEKDIKKPSLTQTTDLKKASTNQSPAPSNSGISKSNPSAQSDSIVNAINEQLGHKQPHNSTKHRRKPASADFDRHSRTGITESKVKYSSGREGWKKVIENSTKSPEEITQIVGGEQSASVESDEPVEQEPAYITYQEFMKEQNANRTKINNSVTSLTRKLNEGVDNSVLKNNVVLHSKLEDEFFVAVSSVRTQTISQTKKEPKNTVLNLRDVPTSQPRKSKEPFSSRRSFSGNGKHSDDAIKRKQSVNVSDACAFPSL